VPDDPDQVVYGWWGVLASYVTARLRRRQARLREVVGAETVAIHGDPPDPTVDWSLPPG